MLLSLSCAGNSRPIVPLPVAKCSIPAFPTAPALQGEVCGNKICLTIPEVVELSLYQARIDETKSALLGCSLIIWKDK